MEKRQFNVAKALLVAGFKPEQFIEHSPFSPEIDAFYLQSFRAALLADFKLSEQIITLVLETSKLHHDFSYGMASIENGLYTEALIEELPIDQQAMA